MILIGAGSHSKQIRDILLLNNISDFKVYDDYKTDFYEHKIEGKVDDILKLEKTIPIFCGIGDNDKREETFVKFSEHNWINIIHPNSWISPTSKIGIGNYIGYNSYIGPDTILGNGNIINEYAAILHDTVLENYNHISIKASVGARNTLGDHNFFGMHSLSIPDICIGNKNIIGANTTIIRNIDDCKKLVGSPARYINYKIL